MANVGSASFLVKALTQQRCRGAMGTVERRVTLREQLGAGLNRAGHETVTGPLFADLRCRVSQSPAGVARLLPSVDPDSGFVSPRARGAGGPRAFRFGRREHLAPAPMSASAGDRKMAGRTTRTAWSRLEPSRRRDGARTTDSRFISPRARRAGGSRGFCFGRRESLAPTPTLAARAPQGSATHRRIDLDALQRALASRAQPLMLGCSAWRGGRLTTAFDELDDSKVIGAVRACRAWQ
jgi:hypothetical protein